MDLYEILGGRRGAGGGEIRRAYRRLARRYHPDLNPGDREAQARYAQIARAFETLNDPERRRAYDAGVPLEAAEPAQSYGFEGFDFSVQATVGAEASTFGELFADVLTRTLGGGEAGPQRGAHLHATLTVSLAEAMTGERVALLLGAEGPGLTEDAMRVADVRARIPMSAGTDSLNVATAAAMAFYERIRTGS